MASSQCDVKELVNSCKSLKIMPSFEDTLHQMGFSTDLDVQVAVWFDQLQSTWRTWKRNAAVENHVDALFRSRPDPFRIALLFVIKSEEYKDCKPKTLPFFIIEILLKFSHSYYIFAEESIKLPAFHIALNQRNQNFFSLMVKTYRLATIKSLVVPAVVEMIKNDNCRQASQIVIAMEMFNEIPVESLLFPLILQGKSNMIDKYLSECPSQVKPLLKFLDKLIDKNFRIKEFVQNYAEENNICHVKYDRMHYIPLGKLVGRLCNKFNVPIETCANLSKNRTAGGLRYLIYQKYVAHNVSSTVWDDLVKDSLRQYPDSAQAFIDMLTDYDKNEALKWARYLNIPQNQLPFALRGKQAQCETVKEPEEENWDTETVGAQEPLYHKSVLTRKQIIIVDSGEKFQNMLTCDLVNQDVVGLDCEWKPSFGAKQRQVAIIQIGTKDKAYLIDTMLLNNTEHQNMWHLFYKSFLDNAEIIKLGFGLEQDLREMKKSIIGLGNIKVKGEGFLDLSILWKSLLNHKLSLGTATDSGASLSSVVQSCFGKPLEKSEQCSNWELRPLRESQIEYAALDAHILLQIYYFLEKKCKEQKIKFEEIANDVMVESKKKATKKPKVIDRLQDTLPLGFESKSASDMRFLVEPMLSYIMSYLRYCGIDTCIVSNPKTLWHDMINLAISDDRYVLIIKPKSSPTVNFPQSSILSVGRVSVREQLHNIINTYKVNIENTDILSRCLHCNTKEMRKLNPTQVQQICREYLSACSKPNVASYSSDHDEEEDNYSRFISDSDDDEVPGFIQAKPSFSNQTCKTSKGAPIEISNPQQLQMSQKSAILCEACGKLYSTEDSLLQSISKTVFEVIKLTHTLE